jgi:hypothetical protein
MMSQNQSRTSPHHNIPFGNNGKHGDPVSDNDAPM